MKNTIKKIVATISAAAMCAIPMANALTADAAISPNARYTFRKVYFVDQSADIKNVVFRWIINSNGTSAPQAYALAPGQLINGNTGGPNRHVGAGTYSPDYHYTTGAIFSQSYHSNTTSPTEYGNYIEVYNSNNQQLYNKVTALDSFLVGDIDGDKDIDEIDRKIITKAINDDHFSASSFTQNNTTGVTIYHNNHNMYFNVSVYKLDINDDGVVNNNDYTLFRNYYYYSSPQRFER